MAEKTVKDTGQYPVEKLQKELQIPDALHAGTCVQMGWIQGKEISRKEYIAALERFKGAAGRRRNA